MDTLAMGIQEERRRKLIEHLAKESGSLSYLSSYMGDEVSQKRVFRMLLNVRLPRPIDESILELEDSYLQEELNRRGVVSLDELTPVKEGIYLWRGDITRLKVDAIVNAANPGMTGCYVPNHGCIDNAIHTYAGMRLRLECARIMEEQGYEEPIGQAKITKGYNLPAKHVIHTVGPMIHGRVSNKNRDDLRSCYMSCLKIADENNLDSIAFCCISTGEYGYPNEEGARVAVDAVYSYKKETGSHIKVVFDVWKEMDLRIYESLLGRD